MRTADADHGSAAIVLLLPRGRRDGSTLYDWRSISRLLGLGERFPEFSMHACVSAEPGSEFRIVDSHNLEGKWAAIFFWPLDFTFRCPFYYPGAPHGITATHQDQVNAELLAFLRGSPETSRRGDRMMAAASTNR